LSLPLSQTIFWYIVPCLTSKMAEVYEKKTNSHDEVELGGSKLDSPLPLNEEPVVTLKTWVVVFVSSRVPVRLNYAHKIKILSMGYGISFVSA
jgi:hypothetical protein